MVKCVYRSEGCDITRPKVEQKWTNMKWIFDESVVELKPNMPTYSSCNCHPKRWFHVVPFNGIAIIDAIFGTNFRTDPSEGTCCTLKESNLVGLSKYEQPGILGSGISGPLFTEIFATKMRLEKKKTMPHLENSRVYLQRLFGSPPSKDCRFSRKLPLQLTHLQTCSLYCYKLRYSPLRFFGWVYMFFCFVAWYAKNIKKLISTFNR